MNTKILTALAGSSLVAIVAATPVFAQTGTQIRPPAPTAPAQPPTTDGAVAAAAEQEGKNKDEIIITGTQIRGATPAGQTLLTTTAKQAEEQGASNGNEILSQIPQASNFFQSLPSLGGLGGAQTAGLVAIARLPNQQVSLRSLPNVNTGGSPTLVLIDGHRVVPTGTNVLGGQAVDNSTISASSLLRSEIMPDGASAIYGSDAVTGVINYITRDDFEGIQVQARAGVARSYWQYDGSVTAGTKWDTGSVFATFAYSHHDALLGKDRDYFTTLDRNPSSPLFNQANGLNCLSPNIAITSDLDPTSLVHNARRLYPLTAINGTIQPFTTNGGQNGGGQTGVDQLGNPTFSTNANAGGNRCASANDFTSYYPEEKRYNALFGLKQEITDNLTFSLKAWWVKRQSETSSGQNINPTVASTNTAIYRPVCTPTGAGGTPQCGVTPGFFAGDDTRTQTISTTLGSVMDPAFHSFVTLESWQVTPSLSWDLPFLKDWQVRALASYGESQTFGIQGSIDTTTLQSRVNGCTTTPANCINPYNLPASAPGAFDRINLYAAQVGRYHLFNAKAVADGPVLKLPGGDLRVAVGTEYIRTSLAQAATASVQSPTPSNFILVNPVIPSDPDPFVHYTQIVKAAFAEVQIPIVSGEMNVPLIYSLNVSASARYDKYNDFGHTFNKMGGITWEPVEWIKLRGNYNTSFAAPNNLTELGTVTGAQANNSTCNGPTGSGCLPTGTSSRLPFFLGFIPPGGANGGQAGPAGLTQTQIVALAPINATQPTGLAIATNAGTVPGIGPQTSKTWSLGFDIEPPFIPGLSFGGSFYNLKISGAIAAPLAPNVQSLFDQHPELLACHNAPQGHATPAACAIPMDLAELLTPGPETGWLVPITTPGGIALPSSLTTTGLGSGSGTNLAWSTALNNYCGPTSSTLNGVADPAHSFQGGNCNPNSYSVFYVADNRTRNLGNIFATGIDFHAAYRTNVPWGSVDARVAGTVTLTTKSQVKAGDPKIDLQAFSSNFRLSANLGTTSGGFRAEITWQHSAGFPINPSNVGSPGTSDVPGTGAFGQTHVKGYDTFDLFFSYDFDSWAEKNGLFKDLSLTLNVNNFLDTNPPRSGGTFANGSTLGRMFQVGLTKKFGGH